LGGTPARPLAVQIVPAPKSQEEAKQDERERNEKSSSDWWVVKLTALLVIVGSVQTVVFWVQARRLRQTIIKMDEVAKDATRIGQAQVRAYVTITKARVRMSEIHMNGVYYCDEPSYELEIVNSGNSPALSLRWYAETHYLSTEVGYFDALRTDKFGMPPEKWGFDVPARETFKTAHQGVTSRLNQADLDQFKEGKLQLITTFYTIFTDVFGNRINSNISFRADFPKNALRALREMGYSQTTAKDMANIAAKLRADREKKASGHSS
jgi:hypothetical protein